MQRYFFIIGSGLAMVGVITGAFGAHGLKGRISGGLLEIFEVAVRYQMYHALGLLAVAWAVSQWSSQLINLAGWSFVIGTCIFSGSLYILSLTGIRWFGAITPIGGLVLIVGWACLIWGTMRG